MPPPELARDAPRFDILEPVEIHLFILLGQDLDITIAHGVDGGLHNFRGLYEPLVGQHRLDHDFGSVTKRLHDLLGLDQRDQRLVALFATLFGGKGGFDRLAQARIGRRHHDGQAFGGDIGDDLGARLEPVEAAVVFGHEVDLCRVRGRFFTAIGDGLCARCGCVIGQAVGAHGTASIHQRVERNVVTFGDAVVVEVMRAGDLDRARAEILVGVFVGDDRDAAALRLGADRDFAELANDGRIAFVRGVYRDRAIAQHGFGAGRRDGDIVAFFGQRYVTVFVFLDVGVGRAIGQRVFEVPHVAVNFGGFDLEVGNRGLEMRVPVDQTLAAIDQPFVVHIHEDLDHGVVEVAFLARGGTRRTGHGESVARPIKRGAQAFELADNRAAGLLLLLPDFGGEFFAGEIGAAFAVFRKLAFHHHLRRDTGVVLTGLPQRVKAAHAVPAHQNVLQCIVECMAHVQRPCHVGRRDHDREGFLARGVGTGLEGTGVFPCGIEAGFGLGGVKILVEGHDQRPSFSVAL